MALSRPADWPSSLRVLAGFVLGVLVVTGFAPFDFSWLMLPLLAAMLLLLHSSSGLRDATFVGYAFGLGLMGFGVFWLRNSIGQFGGVDPWLAVLATVLFSAVVALYFALFAGLAHFLRKGQSTAQFLLMVMPLTWVVVEWLRGWVLTGFPWLSLGYSQLDTPLAGFAPVLGTFGVSGLLVFSSALIAYGVLQRRAVWTWPLLAVVWLSGWGLQSIAWTQPVDQPIQVSLLQGNIPQQDKWKRYMFQPSLDLYQGMTQAARDSRLVIWPETAVSAFDTDVETSLLQPLHVQLQAQQRDLLTGIVAREPNGDYYNAMISLGISGRDAYRKRHLVPFGEFMPLRAVLDPILDFLQIPMSQFTAGDDSAPIIELAGQPMGINICYEDAFAAEVMRALPEATVLVNASNDAWFGDSFAPHQHLQIARMRSVETGRYLLRATNTGVSAVIDEKGQVRKFAPQFEQSILTDWVQPLQGMTPYARVGNWPLLILAFGVLAWVFIQRRRAG